MAKQRNPRGFGTYKKLSDGRVAWRQVIDGDAREVSAKTQKELVEKVKQISNVKISKEKYRVDEWFDKWLETYIKPLKKDATYNQYFYMNKGYIVPVIGKRKLSTIKSIDIQTVIAEANKKNAATKTMRHIKTTMSGAFSKAFKEKLIHENPVVDIEIPNKQAKTQKTLNISELSLIFKAMSNSRWLWSVRFMLVTGLRRGELLALRWTDIDLENKRIVVDESNSITGVGDTKSSKVHYVPLSANAIYYLDSQRRMLIDEFNPSLFIEELKKNPLVFPARHGRMISPNTYYHLIVNFAQKAGILATPHCLRHTFVYNMRNTLTLKELQLALGHDESTTTLDIYGDMIGDTTSNSAKQIDDVFDKVEIELKKLEEKKKSNVVEFKKVK